jgi:hypothetical protein
LKRENGETAMENKSPKAQNEKLKNELETLNLKQTNLTSTFESSIATKQLKQVQMKYTHC